MGDPSQIPGEKEDEGRPGADQDAVADDFARQLEREPELIRPPAEEP